MLCLLVRGIIAAKLEFVFFLICPVLWSMEVSLPYVEISFRSYPFLLVFGKWPVKPYQQSWLQFVSAVLTSSWHIPGKLLILGQDVYYSLASKHVTLCRPTLHNLQQIYCVFSNLNPIYTATPNFLNPLNPELNPICYLLALLGAHHFLRVSRIRVKSLTIRLLMSYIYDVSNLRVKALCCHRCYTLPKYCTGETD